MIIFFSSVLLSSQAFCLPDGAEIVSGSATFSNPDPSTLQITAQDKTIINFSSFNINQNESVIFALPAISSEILNRVIGGSASTISGNLFSNGIVLLVNPAGILFTPSASINTASFIASTRDISNERFLNSEFIFEKAVGNGADRILVNKGAINVSRGGFGILIAGAINNEGVISADLGTVALACGDLIRFQLSGDGKIGVAIDKGTASSVYDFAGQAVTTQLESTGSLKAAGGTVILKASSVPGLFQKAVNLDGYVSASSFENKDGAVILAASGDVSLSGSIQATKVTVSSDRNIETKAAIDAQRGITFTADADRDGAGYFRQTGGRLSSGSLGSLVINGVDFGNGLDLMSLPLYFIPNYGQIPDSEVLYYIQAQNRLYYFTLTGVYYINLIQDDTGLHFFPVYLSFDGASGNTSLSSGLLAPPHFSYLMGSDPDHFYENIPSYQQVLYSNLYPGISLTYTSKDSRLESIFTVDPLADYHQIQLSYKGIDSLSLDEAGNLVVHSGAGTFTESRPIAYQLMNGTVTPVEAGFELLSDSSYALKIGSYDNTRPLIIDPSLVYSTYLGGPAYGYSLAIDSASNVYVAGYTSSLPTTAGAYDTTWNGSNDAFVSKFRFANSGTSLVYSTYLGGTNADIAYALALDSANNVYVTGYTWSNDFPTTAGAYDTTYNGGPNDIFISKLSPNGAGAADLVYSTYLGGMSDDFGRAIAVDSSGAIYVTGDTYSNNFPTTAGAYKTVFSSATSDAFIAKIRPNGAGAADLAYSTFLGDTTGATGWAIALDPSNNVYVACSGGINFPMTAGAYDTTMGGLEYPNVFIAKLALQGAGAADLKYSTNIGGNGFDIPYSIFLDSAQDVYVTGFTTSNDFPTTAGAYDRTYNGGDDVFVVRLALDSQGASDLRYSTYLGTAGNERGQAMVSDSVGGVYLTGYTSSNSFPTTVGAYDTTFNGGAEDVFVAKLSLNGSGSGDLAYSTYLGGTNRETGFDIVLDSFGNVNVAGYTWSADFPTTAGAYDTTFSGVSDAFMFRFGPLYIHPVAVADLVKLDHAIVSFYKDMLTGSLFIENSSGKMIATSSQATPGVFSNNNPLVQLRTVDLLDLSDLRVPPGHAH